MGRRSGLQNTLKSAGEAKLAELIDWDVTPRRSLTLIWTIAIGALLLIGALAIVVAAALLVAYFSSGATYADWLAIGVGGIAAVIVSICSRLLRRANREASKFPERALFAAKAPTLYLRQFSRENPDIDETGDALTQRDSARPGRGELVGEIVVFILMMLFDMQKSERTLEGLLDDAVARVGPLLCLSDPLRRRSTGAVARLNIQSPRWQEAVEYLLQRCNLVFVHYAPGQAVAWEADTVVRRTRLPVMLWVEYIVVPFADKDPDYVKYFPPEVAEGLRAQGVTAATLGPHDDDRGFLFYLTEERQLKWRRPRAEWKDLSRDVRALLREGRAASKPNPASRATARSGVAAAKAAVYLARRVAVAVMIAVVIGALVATLPLAQVNG